jgi:hypothetical protein
MKSTTQPTKTKIEIKEPLNVNSKEFTNNKYEYYKLLPHVLLGYATLV